MSPLFFPLKLDFRGHQVSQNQKLNNAVGLNAVSPLVWGQARSRNFTSKFEQAKRVRWFSLVDVLGA